MKRRNFIALPVIAAAAMVASTAETEAAMLLKTYRVVYALNMGGGYMILKADAVAVTADSVTFSRDGVINAAFSLRNIIGFYDQGAIA